MRKATQRLSGNTTFHRSGRGVTYLDSGSRDPRPKWKRNREGMLMLEIEATGFLNRWSGRCLYPR